MIVGDRNIFAIEYSIKEFYNTYYIGDGRFILWISGKSYGKTQGDSTSFSLIVQNLNKRIAKQNNEVKTNIKTSFVNLCVAYYDLIYGEEAKEEYFGVNKADIFALFEMGKIVWHGMDEAFDDGSFVFQLSLPNNKIHIVGFKSMTGCIVDSNSVSEIIVDAEVYFSIIYNFINSLRLEYINNIGHDQEIFEVKKFV